MQVVNLSTGVVTVTYSVPSAHYVAISPDGTYLLVFADNSDSVVVFNLSANPVSPTTITGFAAPVNAFFSSDGSTAYVLNCGPECGSANPPSVMSVDLGSKTIKATVPVSGASVGYLNSSTLYVAGTPGANGTFDSVDVSTMTRQTANSVAIGDGYHSTMALEQQQALHRRPDLQQHHHRLSVGGQHQHQCRRRPPASARPGHRHDVHRRAQCDVRDRERLPAHVRH